MIRREPGKYLKLWGLLLAILLGGCGRPSGEGRNMLLVVVDTLRADRMSLYGYPRPTTPNLEAFARESVVFEQARSPAGCTFPSVNSLLTSREPAVFLLDPAGTMVIPETVRGLPEILRGKGYSTAAVSASPIVRHTGSKINPLGGFGRGFQVFDESCFEKHAGCINERAGGLVQALREPWFLYLHYMEPHAPYRPPRGYDWRFAKAPAAAAAAGVHRWARRGDPTPAARRIYDGEIQNEFNPADLAHLSDLYDDEIAFFDQEFAKLVGMLRERGLLESTVIALVADHGEEMYEHEQLGHCRNIAYETVLKTPLLMRIPGAEKGVRRKALVNNLDVVPTLLDYLKLPVGDTAFDGSSLRPVIEGDRPVRRLSFGSQGLTRTATDGTLKLSLDLGSGRALLFDLSADPGEKSDLASQRPQEVRRLRDALLRWIEKSEGAAASGQSRSRAEELEKRLRSLGYL